MEYTFPLNSFFDTNGVNITYAVSYENAQRDWLATSGDVPTWLRFDAATRTFSGTPERNDTGGVLVTLRAASADGVPGEADEFTVSVTGNSYLRIALAVVGPIVSAIVTAISAYFARYILLNFLYDKKRTTSAFIVNVNEV